MTFAEKLYYLRTENGYSQESLDRLVLKFLGSAGIWTIYPRS